MASGTVLSRDTQSTRCARAYRDDSFATSLGLTVRPLSRIHALRGTCTSFTSGSPRLCKSAMTHHIPVVLPAASMKLPKSDPVGFVLTICYSVSRRSCPCTQTCTKHKSLSGKAHFHYHVLRIRLNVQSINHRPASSRATTLALAESPWSGNYRPRMSPGGFVSATAS